MTVEIEDNGRISSYVGDTILFNCNNVPTDLPYIVYFAAMYKDGTSAFDPIQYMPYDGNVDVEVPSYITDLVLIPDGKKYVDLIYSLKACNADNQVEHTLQIADNPVGTENILRMYRKQNEGIITVEPVEDTTTTSVTTETTETTNTTDTTETTQTTEQTEETTPTEP